MNIDVFSDARLVAGDRTYKCAIGKGGVSSSKTEGDNATPTGCYQLRRVLYRADRISRPNTNLPLKEIKLSDGWCDDPVCPDYNRLVKLPHAGGFEKLWREDHIYDIMLPIGYNDNPPVAGKGSAIFLHMAREDYSPTRGCVALAKDDLLELLRKFDPDTQICIHDKND